MAPTALTLECYNGVTEKLTEIHAETDCERARTREKTPQFALSQAASEQRPAEGLLRRAFALPYPSGLDHPGGFRTSAKILEPSNVICNSGLRDARRVRHRTGFPARPPHSRQLSHFQYVYSKYNGYDKFRLPGQPFRKLRRVGVLNRWRATGTFCPLAVLP
jgi:hypothetical protein